MPVLWLLRGFFDVLFVCADLKCLFDGIEVFYINDG